MSEHQLELGKDIARCDVCDRPLATQQDYDTTREGEGAHLCWAAWGSHCDPHDWRAEALNLRAERDASIARAERAEAQLAALRKAVRSMREKHDAELEEWALAAGGQRNDRLAAERERDEAARICEAARKAGE